MFRVRSELHDWWEQTLVPWVHYIPVDYHALHPEVLALDLEAKHLWALARPNKSAQIARNGALAAQKAHRPNATMQCAKGVLDCLLPKGWETRWQVGDTTLRLAGGDLGDRATN